jgi:ATP-dependent protease ClpP protease subunit
MLYNRATLKAQTKIVLNRKSAEWYRIENKKADDATHVYIYDVIGEWYGEGLSADTFVQEFNKISSKNIVLHLNTPGGDVFEGISIMNALKSHPSNVDVLVDGQAASIGSVIVMGGDNVTMTRGSMMMIHDGLVAMGSTVVGNAADVRAGAEEMLKLADLLDKTSNNIASIYADRAGGTVDEWRELMLAETWFTADEAVKAGLADEVQGLAKTETENKQPAPPLSAKREEISHPDWDLKFDLRSAIKEAIPA